MLRHGPSAVIAGHDANSVIASVSEAIHRAASQEARMDCFVASAPLRKRFAFVAGNDVETWVRDLAARVARGLPLFWRSPRNKGRAGMPGARCTRGLVCRSYQGKRTRAYRSTEITRHPRTQWLYGLSRDLPGPSARFVTVTGGISSTGLMPAWGIGTTRFFRTPQVLNVKKHLPRPPQPAPRL